MPGLTGRNTGGLPPDLQSKFAPLDILHARDGSAQVGAPLVPGHLWSFLGLQVLGRREYAASFQAPAPPTDQHDERAVAHVEASLGGLKLDGFYIPDRQQTVGKVFDALTSPEATANIRTANDIWQTRATFTARYLARCSICVTADTK